MRFKCGCVYRTSAASVELLPRGWRAVAFPRLLHDQISSSTWLIVIIIVRHCFGGLCVRDRLAACLRTSHFYAASVEPLPRGSRAVAFPRWLQVLSCSTCGTWVIVHCSSSCSCCINSCVLAYSLALIPNSNVWIPSAELRPQDVEALLMLPSQALLLLCHYLDNNNI